MHHPFKVLLIEDNPGDARLIQEAIREVNEHEVELEFANRLEIGLKRLGHNALDCVLLDLGLPD
jgi:CheY-like chemotaxis protein